MYNMWNISPISLNPQEAWEPVIFYFTSNFTTQVPNRENSASVYSGLQLGVIIFFSVKVPTVLLWEPTSALNLGGLGGGDFCVLTCVSRSLVCISSGSWAKSFLYLPPLGRPCLLLPLPQEQWALGGFPALPCQLQACVTWTRGTRRWETLRPVHHWGELALRPPDLPLVFLLSTCSRPDCEPRTPLSGLPVTLTNLSQSFKNILAVSSFLPSLQFPFPPMLY